MTIYDWAYELFENGYGSASMDEFGLDVQSARQLSKALDDIVAEHYGD